MHPRVILPRDMPTTGVILMTYGSPRDLDDVGAYITRIRGGRAPDEALLAEFRRRYDMIGMSPLIEITRQQASGLEEVLGPAYRVAAGMRFSEPSVSAAVSDVHRPRGETTGRPDPVSAILRDAHGRL